MKSIVLLFFCLLIVMSVWSQRTISVLSSGAWTFYTDLSAALNQCSPNSIIYLPGGIFSLSQGIDTVDKSITLIGVGHYPDSTLGTDASIVLGSLYFKNGGDNTFFQGIDLVGRIYPIGGNTHVSNLTISRCRINRVYLSDNINSLSANLISFCNISESVIDSSLMSSLVINQDLKVTNCIISTNGQVGGLGVKFKNNVFLDNNSSSGYGCQQQYCVFENNVILTATAANFEIEDHACNSIFRNNIFNANSYTFFYSNNTSINNVFVPLLSDIFVNVGSVTSFSYSSDYSLTSTCIGKNAGSDGTDIGIYGTSFPYKEGGVPANPHVSSKSISSSSSPNGTLLINIRVTSQDN